MKTKSINVIRLLLVSFVVALSVQPARAANPGPEETAIRASAKAFIEAYNKGDAKAVAALWTEDGDYSIGADTIKGRDAIAQIYDGFFKSHPGSKMDVRIDSVRVVAPTVAVEEGTASVSGSTNEPTTSSAYTAIHVKQKDGTWLMASVRESDVPALVREDLKELGWLIGTWNAQGDEANVEISYEWFANNNFIRGETKVRSKADGKEASGGTQIIGRDPLTGQIVSWFFNADGGHGYGSWIKDEKRWLVQSQGATVDGAPTTSVNVLYHADNNVMSWQSVNRTLADQPLPDTKEIVIERAGTTAAAAAPAKK